MAKTRFLFLGLSAFSQAGGIEKVNKTWLKALSDLEEQEQLPFKSHILLDDLANERYVKAKNFQGFKGAKLRFFLASFWQAIQAEGIIASHINLAPLLYLIKLFQPHKKIYLHAHGIEVWRPLNKIKKGVLRQVDVILAVSQFTKDQLISKHQITPNKIRVLPNALDPYFETIPQQEKVLELKKRYQLSEAQPILFTLTRLSFAEQYKGYDIIIKVLPRLILEFQRLQYLIGGKADREEQERIRLLIKKLNLTAHVQLLGYIAEEELTAHYQMADAFVMPSEGEGFGISFIEASACGVLVLAGNLDGSTQAVKESETGYLCNPKDEEEVYQKLRELILKEKETSTIQNYTLQHFGFEAYKLQIAKLLNYSY